MTNWRRLALLRKVLIAAGILLSLAVLVANSVALVFLDTKLAGAASIQGASGWTMFVTLLTIIALPLTLTRHQKLQKLVNRTGIELIILSVLSLFWFISSIALAAKSTQDGCLSRRLCHRVRATTAFAWLTFFGLLAAMTTVGLIARKQVRCGLPLLSAYSFDIVDSPLPQHSASMGAGEKHAGN